MGAFAADDCGAFDDTEEHVDAASAFGLSVFGPTSFPSSVCGSDSFLAEPLESAAAAFGPQPSPLLDAPPDVELRTLADRPTAAEPVDVPVLFDEPGGFDAGGCLSAAAADIAFVAVPLADDGLLDDADVVPIFDVIDRAVPVVDDAELRSSAVFAL